MKSLMQGRPMLGTGMLTTGLYPPQQSRALTSLTNWAANPQDRNLEMIRSVKANRDPELDEK
eukprot:5617549-Pyramimonas_sp.AAC.1